jgi:cytochrome c553
VPSLGAQPAFYVTLQLYMFRARMRVVEPMNEATRDLSDDELRRMADWIAQLPPPLPTAAPRDPARLERARALIQQHRCHFCHNQDFSGAQNVPRLAGQREDYLVKALRDYKSNARRGYDAAMADVLYAVSDADILDLAHFLAHLQ